MSERSGSPFKGGPVRLKRNCFHGGGAEWAISPWRGKVSKSLSVSKHLKAVSLLTLSYNLYGLFFQSLVKHNDPLRPRPWKLMIQPASIPRVLYLFREVFSRRRKRDDPGNEVAIQQLCCNHRHEWRRHLFFFFHIRRPSDLYKKWVSSGEDKSEDRHQLLSVRSLSGVFFLGASLALVASFFLFLENKLFAKGFIYANICADPIVEKGQRKISAEVKRKLLDFSKFAKEGEEYPDISGYMHNRRRRTLMLKSLYNPKSVKRKYEETGEQVTATSSVWYCEGW